MKTIKKNRKVVLDTETTGLSVEKGDRIIEIGCIEIVNYLVTDNYFHCYINPERDIPAAASRIHGITLDMVKHKPIFRDIAESFLEFIQDSPLVIHNAKFDISFLNAELHKVKKSTLNIKNVVDTLLIARNKFPGSPASLDALCKRFNISLKGRDHHGALLDAQLLSKVYLELSYLEQIDLFNEYAVNECAAVTPSDLEKEVHQSSLYATKKYNISEEELKMHKNFLGKVKNPLWGQS